MYALEALDIHFELWSAKEKGTTDITYRGVKHPVVVLDKPSKKFAFVELGYLRLVTQNMAKNSVHTEWCRNTENGKITWIFKNNEYDGKIVSYTKNGVWVNQVFKLNPEHKVFQSVI